MQSIPEETFVSFFILRSRSVNTASRQSRTFDGTVLFEGRVILCACGSDSGAEAVLEASARKSAKCFSRRIGFNGC